MGSGPATISRFDRARQVSLEANLQGISLGDAVTKVQVLPAMNPLPDGVEQRSDGNAQIMIDVFSPLLRGVRVSCLRNLRHSGLVVQQFPASTVYFDGITLIRWRGTTRINDCSERTGIICFNWHCVIDGFGDKKCNFISGLFLSK